jgi:uncharacterized protein (TIGR02757 family)
MHQTTRTYLFEAARHFNQASFIESDPISIPKRFSKKQDIEIAGLWTAVLSWGQRKTIIAKASQLMELMDNAPFEFVVNHSEKDRRRFLNFVHRTFQPTDTMYFLEFFQWYYKNHHSLEEAFVKHLPAEADNVTPALEGFHDLFFSLENAPKRTRKHLPSPRTGSTCKRLNMFLRWMVRKDEAGVDFGIWQQIKPSQLLIPLDVHVERVARKLGLLTRKQRDWKAVIELSQRLKEFHPEDPVLFDFALFGMGVLEK